MDEVQEVQKLELVENKKTGLLKAKYIISFDAGKELYEELAKIPNKSDFIRQAVKSYFEQRK